LKEECGDPMADSIRVHIRIESASGVETIGDLDVRVRASGKTKGRRNDLLLTSQLLIDAQKQKQRTS
jgi:hypothetical protein